MKLKFVPDMSPAQATHAQQVDAVQCGPEYFLSFEKHKIKAKHMRDIITFAVHMTIHCCMQEGPSGSQCNFDGQTLAAKP